MMKALRDPSSYSGKCGVCEFNWICGGSRARAHAMLGDPLASDPTCVYQPAGLLGVHETPSDPESVHV